MIPIQEKEKAVLLLEDGTVYLGKAGGYKGVATGEVCFNTGMTGYQEIFTDPSYSNQMLLLTNAHIGNYGICKDEVESKKIQIAGLVCSTFNIKNFRQQADESIQEYFETSKVVCVHGLDTREIVRHVRDKGAMNCIISNDGTSIDKLKVILSKVPSMEGLELASTVSTTETYTLGDEQANHKVAVLDFGVKRSILDNLVARDCYVKVFNAKTSLQAIQGFEPDAFFFSNGPGDPESMDYAVALVKQILALDKPVFGICLGHQVIALALGLKTYKMHNGHRGINHPIINLLTGKCEVTTQNHGFGLDRASVEEMSDKIEITHINLNDNTVEGIRVKGQQVFSVQYHPEASPGPHDSRYLFDDFVKNIVLSKK